MNLKFLLALIFALLLISNNSFVRAQEEDDQEEQNNQSDDDIEIIEEGVNNQNTFTFKNDGETDIQEQLRQFQEQMQQQKMHEKNMYAICTILSNSQINLDNVAYQEIMKGNADGQALYQKIQAEHIVTCMDKVDPQQAQQLAEEMNSNTFDAKNWGQIFMELTPSRYSSGDIDIALTEDEQKADKYATELKEEWQSMQDEEQQRRQVEEQQQPINPIDFEPKLFGYSYKEIPTSFKLLFTLFVIAFVAGVVYFGFQQIQKEQEPRLTQKQQKNLLKKQAKKEKNN